MINRYFFSIFLFTFLVVSIYSDAQEYSSDFQPMILEWQEFTSYIQEFNHNDEPRYQQFFTNSDADDFLKNNIPYFNCPDKEFEKTYYFRWWTYRKHIKETLEGFVITEFFPDVPWAGMYNTISCAAGHHFYEGRWLHNNKFLTDYAKFWFNGKASPRSYSFWASNSIQAFASVHKKQNLTRELLPHLVNNYEEWEKSNLMQDGLFTQIDDRDGMEESIGGSGKRATINSYMVGEAEAISQIAQSANKYKLANEYKLKAEALKTLILTKLWDKNANFFKTLPNNSSEHVNVRELHGYTPWYFNIPNNEHSVAWEFVKSNDGFKAPFGLTTAEQSHPKFRIDYSNGGDCQWNGPSWPYSTSITLKAMANLLNNYDQSIVTKSDYIELLNIYSNSHRLTDENGNKIPWIDENIDPLTGNWLSRHRKKVKNSLPIERGRDYNHSEFCDLIINDLIGIKPTMEDGFVCKPLITSDYWGWFCLDNVKYHDRLITIYWDENGKKYNKGKGFYIYVDGVIKFKSKTIPETVNIKF